MEWKKQLQTKKKYYTSAQSPSDGTAVQLVHSSGTSGSIMGCELLLFASKPSERLNEKDQVERWQLELRVTYSDLHQFLVRPSGVKSSGALLQYTTRGQTIVPG